MMQTTTALRRISASVFAFVRAPETIRSLIDQLVSAAQCRQRNMVAATKDSLAVAARGHAVLRLQHGCQSAAATAAVFKVQLQQSRSPLEQEPGHMDMNGANGAKTRCQSQTGSSIQLGRAAVACSIVDVSADGGSQAPHNALECHAQLNGGLDPAHAPAGMRSSWNALFESSDVVYEGGVSRIRSQRSIHRGNLTSSQQATHPQSPQVQGLGLRVSKQLLICCSRREVPAALWQPPRGKHTVTSSSTWRAFELELLQNRKAQQSVATENCPQKNVSVPKVTQE